MPLSWNEIKKRAIEFSKSWEGVEREKAEAQTFWNEFFDVFGVNRRRVAVLEQEVKKLDDSKGYIDLFWPKVLLAEAKSKGKDLIKAKVQAISYLHGIADDLLPKFILTSNFERMVLLDLESGDSHDFFVSKLHENIKLFSFIAGYTKTDFKPEDPVNIKAAELMGKFHDTLKSTGYSGHPLEVFLVRILFCLFADDTGIFEKGIFFDFVRNKTKEDGTDLGPQLAQLFQVLNTAEKSRFTNLDEDLLKFPYVNGSLFEESIPLASFDSQMRKSLIECSAFDWSKISPAVFGSLFQSVMNQEQRRNLGAHYTTELNILKLIRPLFLDELWEELERCKSNKNKLNEFHKKLATLKFLDPACGCGNFLVITYRELRLLELEILKIQLKSKTLLDVEYLSLLDVNQMYGIEIEEFPAKIAEVAMWLMDHQMNLKLSEELGQYYIRLPLKNKAKIINGNALQLNWEEIISKNELGYILGNPPFVGKQMRTKDQTADQDIVMKGIKGSGVLDFVACWYIKAAQYIQDTKIKVAFVSTNSITQGEQVGILWNEMFKRYGVKIYFAHRTFQWNSEAKGKAAVHVVIIGFGTFDAEKKYLFEYEHIKGEPHQVKVKNINPYLVEGGNTIILAKNKVIQNEIPAILFGSKLVDNGNYLFTEKEKDEFIDLEPNAKVFFREIISGDEFLNGRKRWCLWLKDVAPNILKACKLVMERVENVRNFRLSSPKILTQKAASRPTLFAELRQPEKDYLLIPLTSSENRLYIPLCFFSKDKIITNSCSVIIGATNYHYGIIQSHMHMSWMRTVAGRLKSDYRYSNKLVYNNFPWPQDPTEQQKKTVEEKAQAVLDVRKDFSDATLADLYNPLTMPPKLLKAHRELDLAVDKCYRSKPFKDDRERIEFLFNLYEKLTAKSNDPK